MANEKEKKVPKRPTALKRQIQNQKKRLINRAFKEKVKTAIRSAQAKGKEAPDFQEALSDVYRFLDKGVKRGIYSSNKAARLKSRVSSAA